MDESYAEASLRLCAVFVVGEGRLTLSILSPRDLKELLDVGDLGRHVDGWVVCVEKKVLGPWSSVLLGWLVVGMAIEESAGAVTWVKGAKISRLGSREIR
jgi:hypothetical protein